MVDTPPDAAEPLKPADWPTLADDKLLEVRMCDLQLTIAGTELEARIAQLNAELEARGLVFKPHYYLSDEWFTPDGVPGIAIPEDPGRRSVWSGGKYMVRATSVKPCIRYKSVVGNVWRNRLTCSTGRPAAAFVM